MAAKEIVVKVTADTSTAITSINQLDTAIKTMQDQLKQTDLGTEEFDRLTAEINKAKAAMDNLTKASEKSEKQFGEFANKAVGVGDSIEKVGTGIAGAFSVATGVVGAFGGSLGFSTEQIEEAQQKASSYIAILTGLKPVLEGVKAVQMLLNAVMIANPIGLIVVAVGALIAAFIAFREPIIEFLSNWENLETIMLALLGPIGWIIIAYDKLFSAEAQAETAREKAAAEERARAAERRKQQEENIKNIEKEKDAKIAAADETIHALELEKDTLEAQGKSSDEVTVKILEAELAKTKAVLDANTQKLQSWVDYYKNEALLAGVSEEEFIKNQMARGIDLLALQDKVNEVIAENEYNVQLSENAITKFKREQHDERVADNQKAQAEIDAQNKAAYEAELARLHNLQEQRMDFLMQLEAAENAHYDSLLTAQQREENAVRDKYFNLIQQAEQYGEDTAILEEAQKMQLDAIDAKYDQIADDRKQKNIDDFNAWQKEEIEKEQQKTAAKIEMAQNIANATIALTQAVFDIANNYGKQDEASREKRAKRQFQINKALALSAAVIDGFKAITASLAASPLVIGVIPNPVGIANLIITAATTAANIAKIAATKYEPSGGGGGASAASVPTASAGAALGGAAASVQNTPSFNLFGQGNNLNNVGPGGSREVGGGSMTIKAYVSETDIQKTSDRLNLIRSNAEL